MMVIIPVLSDVCCNSRGDRRMREVGVLCSIELNRVSSPELQLIDYI